MSKKKSFKSYKSTDPLNSQPAPSPARSQATSPSPLLEIQPLSSPERHQPVRPEQMSLEAYQHIQTYLNGREKLNKDEVTSILRLSQHLRVFGLLSAVGYLNHGKDSGEVAKRTKPVWSTLLNSLIVEDNSDLMKQVKDMAEDQPTVYMATWRKSLILSKYWNFWAKAYQEEE